MYRATPPFHSTDLVGSGRASPTGRGGRVGGRGREGLPIIGRVGGVGRVYRVRIRKCPKLRESKRPRIGG